MNESINQLEVAAYNENFILENVEVILDSKVVMLGYADSHGEQAEKEIVFVEDIDSADVIFFNEDGGRKEPVKFQSLTREQQIASIESVVDYLDL